MAAGAGPVHGPRRTCVIPAAFAFAGKGKGTGQKLQRPALSREHRARRGESRHSARTSARPPPHAPSSGGRGPALRPHWLARSRERGRPEGRGARGGRSAATAVDGPGASPAWRARSWAGTGGRPQPRSGLVVGIARCPCPSPHPTAGGAGARLWRPPPSPSPGHKEGGKTRGSEDPGPAAGGARRPRAVWG